MAILYVTEQGATVGFTGGRIVVRKDKHILDELPVIKLEQIVAVGRINITPWVINYCLRAGVEISYLSSPGHFAGRLQPEPNRNVIPRQRQFERASDADFMLGMAKRIVTGKIRNMIAMVKGQRRMRTEDAASQSEMEAILPRVEGAASADSLYGYEGSASASYFKSVRAALRGDWGFDARIYHPPTDPVNVLLSLGYTLLYKDMHAAISIVGLDPYLGCFHKPRQGHAALASDLIEEHRAVLVDRMVLTTLNKRIIAPDEFQQEADGRHKLAPPAFKRFLKIYADALNETVLYPPLARKLTYRYLIEHQVRHYSRVITGDDPEYRPFEAEAALG